jgi:hypothetical protein
MAQTPQEVLQSTQDLLRRVETEGVTGGVTKTGQQGLLPGQFSAATGEISIPEISQLNPDLSSAQGRTSYYQQLIDSQEKQAEEIAKQREAAITAQKEQRGKIEKVAERFGLIGQRRGEELAELGFDEKEVFAQQKADIAEIEALYEDYDKTVAARDARLAALGAKTGMSIQFKGGEAARINKEANVVLGQKASAIKTKLAIMEMKQGNFENAQKFVNQSIKDYTAALQAEYDLNVQFYEENQALIDDLGKDYTDALKERQALILDQISQAAADKQQEIDNLFTAEGLRLEAGRLAVSQAQEARLLAEAQADAVAGKAAMTIYDDELSRYITEGMSAFQAAQALMTGLADAPTAKERAAINKRAQELYELNKKLPKQQSRQLGEALGTPTPFTTGGRPATSPLQSPQTTAPQTTAPQTQIGRTPLAGFGERAVTRFPDIGSPVLKGLKESTLGSFFASVFGG